MTEEFLAAVKSGNRAAVERLADADAALLWARDENGSTAVLLAHYYGQTEVARALLARKPHLDIFEAAAAGDAKRIRELVAAEPSSLDATSPDGFQPLGLAAFFNRRDAVRALLDDGARTDVASRDQAFTPLHSAVATDTGPCDDEIVRMLLDSNADPNAKSRSGGTPLHTAAFTGDREIVELLLAYGADPSATDNKDHTPLDVAREHRHVEVAAVLHHAVTNRRRG